MSDWQLYTFEPDSLRPAVDSIKTLNIDFNTTRLFRSKPMILSYQSLLGIIRLNASPEKIVHKNRDVSYQLGSKPVVYGDAEDGHFEIEAD